MANILLIDDDEYIITCVSTLLVGAGYTCLAASTADRARELIETEDDIALVLLDQHLGEATNSGLTLVSELRQIPRYEALPVIVCTGDSRPSMLQSFLKFRISGYIKKPFRVDRLLADIESTLHRTAQPSHPVAAAAA